MTEPNYAKQFWKEAIALGSLTEALDNLERLSSEASNEVTPLYDPLWVAFVIAYCRPFTDNRELGQLSDRVVPAEMRGLHQAIMNARNKMLGHTDPQERAGDGLQINRLTIQIKEHHVFPSPARLNPSSTEIPRFLKLVNAVYENVGARVAELLPKLPEIANLEDGDYLFDYTLPEDRRWHRKEQK